MAKTSETDLGIGVMRVLASRPNNQATMRTLILRVPDFVTLTSEDHQPSMVRKNEEMWEQRVRNLKSHESSAGNVIGEGFVDRPVRGTYRLTDAGLLHLKNLGQV